MRTHQPSHRKVGRRVTQEPPNMLSQLWTEISYISDLGYVSLWLAQNQPPQQCNEIPYVVVDSSIKRKTLINYNL